MSERKASNIINHAWNIIKKAINESATTSIGKTTNNHQHKDDFWDEELQHLHHQKRQLWQQINNTNPDQPLFQALTQSLQLAQKEFRKAHRRKRRQSYRTWTAKLQTATPTEAIKILAACDTTEEKPKNKYLHTK
jgi:hypothetical protein